MIIFHTKTFVLIFSLMRLFAYWITKTEYNENLGVKFTVFAFSMFKLTDYLETI